MSHKLLPQETDVVILCGGRGTRLGSLTQETPKPLLSIGDRPFLFHLLQRFQKEGFKRFILAVHYLVKQFDDFAAEHRYLFPDICIAFEETPMGTGGALRNAVTRVQSENFVALNGDVFVTQTLQPVLDYHTENRNFFTMVAVRTENVGGIVRNKGGLDIAENNDIVAFGGHSQINEQWVNAGIYVTNKRKIASWPLAKYDLEKEFFSLMKSETAKAFRSQARLLDIGTPECLKLAKETYETYTLPSC